MRRRGGAASFSEWAGFMIRTLLLSTALLAGLAGCAEYEKIYQPAEYHPVTEMKPGPGLFTGETGVVTLCCGSGAVVGDKEIGADGNGYAGDDYEVVSNKPGEPVIIKRHRPDDQ
jgi:hypothetical protein